MTYIRLIEGSLIIEADADSDIFNWEHKLFLTTVLGYQLEEKRCFYKFDDSTQLFEVLQETADYLSETSDECEYDSAIDEILNNINLENEEFELAKAAGQEAKVGDDKLNLPPGFIRQLREFQSHGVNHLLTVKHGANFSVPGSGKTTTIYAAYEILRQSGIVDKLLVIGPRSCFFPWEDEYRECFGEVAQSGRLTGPKISREGVYLRSDEFDFFLCTYQTASNDVKELIGLCKRHKVFIVLDESHNIKKLKGGVWSDSMLRISPYATRRVILSGTPMPNSYLDIWTQLTFLWPGKQLLGERDSYQLRSEDGNEQNAIRELIRPFFYRVGKKDLDLPPTKTTKIECDMSPYQSSIYSALSTKFLAEVDSLPEDRHILREWRKARIVRLIQAASNPTLLAKYSEEFEIPPIEKSTASVIQLIDEYPKYEVPSKITRALELVDEISSRGEKVVLWTTFIHNINMLSHLLEGIHYFVLYGAVPRDESESIEFNREQQIQDFLELDGPAVLLANPAACAESISLHKSCHHAIYLDRSFNCGQFMQSLDRIHRIGLKPGEEVSYYFLIAVNSIDETIDRRLQEKKNAMEQLLDEDISVGTYETDLHQMGRSEDEEIIDYLETLKDLRVHLK